MFRRIANLIRGFFSLFISGFEKRNPEALLEVEKENLRKQVAKYNEGLASHAGLCERIMTQVKRLEAQEQDLRAKTGANLKAGNRQLAAQQALRLQTVVRELDENHAQLEHAERTYKNLLTARDVAVQTAREKIEGLRKSLDELKMQKAMAELNEMSAGMVSAIGSPGDTLDRLKEMVEDERAKAAGRARVAKDALAATEVEVKEAEQQALAEQALAEFAATEGIEIDSQVGQPEDEAGGSAPKSMGPVPEDQP